MGTRDNLREVAKKTKLPEQKVREVMRALIDEGRSRLVEGDPWLIPDVGLLVPNMDHLGPFVVFQPYPRFARDLNSRFVENREVDI